MPSKTTSITSILISSSHQCLGLTSGLFPSDVPSKTLHSPLFSPIHVTCPAHLILIDLISRVIFGVQYRSESYSLCYLLYPPSHLFPLQHNIFISTLLSNILGLRRVRKSKLIWEWYRVTQKKGTFEMRSGRHVQLAALRNRDLDLQTTSPFINHGSVERWTACFRHKNVLVLLGFQKFPFFCVTLYKAKLPSRKIFKPYLSFWNDLYFHVRNLFLSFSARNVNSKSDFKCRNGRTRELLCTDTTSAADSLSSQHSYRNSAGAVVRN